MDDDRLTMRQAGHRRRARWSGGSALFKEGGLGRGEYLIHRMMRRGAVVLRERGIEAGIWDRILGEHHVLPIRVGLRLKALKIMRSC